MPSLLRVVPVALLCFAAQLPAQASKPDKGGKPAKAEKGSDKGGDKGKGDLAAGKASPQKDDAVTAKDPVIVALDKFIAQKKVSKKNADWRTSLPEPPKQTFAPGREYLWHLSTNKGEITITLLPHAAPMHVSSTIYLTRHGFFDGLTFHRAIKGFMAQGGCPLGNGTGTPGYKMDGELDGKHKHDKAGILSAANEDNKPKTEGSQFFLTFAPAPHLDGKHTVYGEVTAGIEVVQALDAASGTPQADKPTERLVIERAWVTVVEAASGTPGGGAAPKKEQKQGKAP